MRSNAAPSLHSTEMCPEPPIPTPTYPTGGVFSVSSSHTHIAAPASKVYALIVDTTRYPEWNTFVPKAEITGGGGSSGPLLEVGSKMKFTVHMSSGSSSETHSDEIVTLLEADGPVKRIAWRFAPGTGLGWFLHAERVHEIRDREGEEGGGCEYVNFETFGGLLAFVVRAWKGNQLCERFEDWSRDLKRVAERAAGAGN